MRFCFFFDKNHDLRKRVLWFIIISSVCTQVAKLRNKN